MKYRPFFFVLFTCIVFSAGAQANPSELLTDSILNFQNGRYETALLGFRDIILNEDYEKIHGDAYFWISMCYLALNKYSEAAKNLEFFLLNFTDNVFYSEGIYQKGRLLYLQGDYEFAIQILTGFIDSYPESPYISNSYYWIGESLYSLGHFSEAKAIFQKIISEYPSSYKFEASKYRIDIVSLKQREEEMLQLLKMSHEEHLKSIEDFQRKEKEYEQAIVVYQKKITALMTLPDEKIAEIEALNKQLVEKEIQISQVESEKQSLQDEIIQLETNIADLEQSVSVLQSDYDSLKQQLESISTAEVSNESVISSSADESQMKALLELKAEALTLKEFYLDLLIEGVE